METTINGPINQGEIVLKVVILAYDFPSKANTAAQRPYAWWKYFQEMGIYPIVITKNWTNDSYQEEITDRYAIYKLNCNATLIEKHWTKTDFVGKIRRKINSALNLFFHTSFIFGPYSNFYKKGIEVIKEIEGDKVLLATAMPFGMFHVAFRLHKETGIKWVADYRDDWTTTDLYIPTRLNKFCIFTLDRPKEIKWVSTVSAILSVSPHYVDKITTLLSKRVKGYTIENGFFEEEIEALPEMKKFDVLSFVYVGSLYESQDILPIIENMHKVCLASGIKIDFHFLGTRFTEQLVAKLNSYKSNDKLNLIVHERLSKMKALELQLSCHYGVIVPHTGLKGIPSSKLYEFIGTKMPTLVYPNDQDIIFTNLTKTGLGVFANNEEELIKRIEHIVKREVIINPETVEINKLSRKHTTLRLTNILKCIK